MASLRSDADVDLLKRIIKKHFPAELDVTRITSSS